MAQYKIGDKIVPKDGSWWCLSAKHVKADYAIVTDTIPTFTTEVHYYYYDLYRGNEKVGWCAICQDDTNSKLMEKTMEDLQKGDVIANRHGEKATVIERLGDIVFTTGWGQNWRTTLTWNTKELKTMGITIKQPEPEPTELTMQEVADKFGVDVDKLKIVEK